MAAKPKVTYAVNKSDNAYGGQVYAIQKAPGGVYHVYNDGRKVYMPAGKPAAPIKPTPAPAANAPAKPVTQSAASAAAAQPAQPVGGSNDPYAGQVKPDSQYWDQTSGSVFDINQQKAGLDESDRSLRANYDEALRRMAGYESGSDDSARNDANASGLTSSSTLDHRRDDIRTEYARQRADALQGLTGNLDENTTKRQSLDAGFLVDDGKNLEASVGRQIDRDTTQAAHNALAVNTPLSVPKKRRRVQQGSLVAVPAKRRRRRT